MHAQRTALVPGPGLYVHVPFCDGKCGYCAFYSVLHRAPTAERYLAALRAELQQGRRACPAFAPQTVYIGGGTPTMLAAPQLRHALASVRSCFDLTGVTEWSVEANPGSLTPEKLAVLRQAGVNRISLGVQSFDVAALRLLGRRHAPGDALAAAALIRRAGFANWGLDLIACVPGVDRKAWRRTLGAAVALDPAHVSVYALTAEEGTQLTRRMGAGDLALLPEEEQLWCLHAAEERLTAVGYGRYEISNYARPGHECRHNQSCWAGGDYLGFGPAAASRLGVRRWTNRPDLAAYVKALGAGRRSPRETETVTPETQAEEMLVFGLRCREGVEPDGILARVGLADSTLADAWRQGLCRLRREGLVLCRGARWRLTRRGRDLADHVAVELLR